MKNLIKNPLNISIAWWTGWALLASLSLTGIDTPSIKTFTIIALFITTLTIGGMLSTLIPHKDRVIDLLGVQRSEKKLNFLFNASSIILFVVLAILSVKCTMELMTHSGDRYKQLAFSTDTHIGILFNSKILENLYFFISSPLLFYVSIYGLADFWKKTNFKCIAIAFVLNGMDGYIRLARINVYTLIILFLIILIISDNRIYSLLKNKKKQLTVFLISFLSIFAIGFFRGYKTSEQFNRFIVDYHTIGFSLFDYELKNNASPLNQVTTYGRLTFGGLETVLTVIIRQFDRSYYSPALSNSIRMATDQIPLGHDKYNSFYTLLYTFYSDGGFLGIILGGLALGAGLNFSFKKWIKYNNFLDALYTILILSILILSIFVSQLEVMRTWIVFIVLILVDLSGKRFKKTIY